MDEPSVSTAPAVSEKAPPLDLNQELAQVCVDTGATGAAIALLSGDDMICHAASGPQAPGVGVRLDLRAGLSGACIKTRELQQCKDTRTDVRVDAEACRRLRLRSVVVLPLMDGDELFGIFEILSPLPNAFSQFDVDILQTLAGRIVERRRQNGKSNATVAPKESGLLQPKLEKIVQIAKQTSTLPHVDQISRKSSMRTAVLGGAVIAAAMLLGVLVGWRQGWQKATLSVRGGSPVAGAPRSPSSVSTAPVSIPPISASLIHQASTPSNHVHADRTSSPARKAPQASTRKDECGALGVDSQAVQASSGGLTICEQGHVIFRSPEVTGVPVRNSLTSSSSGDSSANTARR